MFNKFYVLKILAPLLSLLLLDCRCHKDQIALKMVAVQLPAGAQSFASKIDQERLQDLVRKVIDQDVNFRLDPSAVDGKEIGFTLELQGNDEHRPKLLLVATLDQHSGSSTEQLKAFADIAIKNGSVSGEDVASAISRVLEDLYRLNGGRGASNREYLQKISDRLAGESIEESELLTAISVLADSKDKRAIGPLIKLLEVTTDLAIGNAAMMALGELKAVEAIDAIIDFAERKPPILRRQAIIAAGRIATKEAAAWLLVMAYGHDDPMVRKEAYETLKKVEAGLKRAN